MKKWIAMLLLCLMIPTISCSKGENSGEQATQKPERIKGESYYTEICLVLPENPAGYETQLAEFLENFLKPLFPVSRTAEHSDDTEILSVLIGKAAENTALYREMLTKSGQNGGYAAGFENGCLIFAGTSSDQTYLVGRTVLAEYFSNDPAQWTRKRVQSLNLAKTGAARNAYVRDISLFETVWQYDWTPPAWLTDFSEKRNAFRSNTRMMVCSHRGGISYYPENSVEAIISSVKMGADMVEIDVQTTRDGILVLGHGTLDEFTDWADKKGKNGLPKSNQIIAWTYAQLQQLNLKFNYGAYASPDGETTPYKIPSFEDVMTVCKDRIFVVMDKLDGPKHWDAVYEVLKKTESTQSFLFGPSFRDAGVSEYQHRMSLDGLAVSMNYYARTHTGNLEAELNLHTAEQLREFFEKYDKKKNNLLTEHELACVQYISEKNQ